jgi:hypothetical protein
MKKKYILLLFAVLSIFLSGGNIYAQDPVCMELYNGGLVLMNKKDKNSYLDAIKKFEGAEFCDAKLRDDCRKRISECRKAIDALPPPAPAPTTPRSTPPTPKSTPPTPKSTPVAPKPASPPEPASVRLSMDKVKFTEQGGIENVTVSGDDKWSISETEDWCDAKRGGNLVVITCNPNKTSLPRKATLEIKGSNSSKTISIEQDAGKQLQTDVPEPSVETEKPESKREDAPEQASSGNSDTVVRRNITRRNLTPARDTVSAPGREVISEQPISRGRSNTSGGEYSPVRDDDSDEREVSSGRKISFGFMANALIPSFSVNSSSALGSAVNYGYGGKLETPSYSSEPGYSGGLVADIRIAKSFYIQTGLYYTNMSINNKIKGERNDKITEYTPLTYLEGTFSYDITEKYTFNYIEVPILASYRIHLSERFIWQVNAGPYIGYGISGKAKIQGTQDWRLIEYNNSNDRPVADDVYRRHNNLTGEIDMFGKTGFSRIAEENRSHTYNFKNAPFQNLNAGVSLGTAFEYAGINVGVYYDIGLMNIANENYWKSERMPVNEDTENFESEDVRINNYAHKLNKIQIRVGYIYRW